MSGRGDRSDDQQSDDGERDLLATIPGGRLLGRLLRLLLSADRRDEFVGDLIEQANAQHAGRPTLQIGLWLWGQTLHSAPALVSLRLRRLARRGGMWAFGPRRARAAHGFPGLLFGHREAARSWPVPMAVSITVHALAVFTLVGWTLQHVDEVTPPWVPVVMGGAIAPLEVAPVEAPLPQESAPAELAARGPRKPRPVPRRAVPAVVPEREAPPDEPALEPALADLDDLDDDDYRAYPADEVVIILPPLVAEKRCLSCPPPKLPPAYVRLGAEQQILVKTCVAASGDVTSVDILRGLGAGADAGVVDTVRGWRFSPHAVDDHPVPFCYPTRFVFAMN